MITVEPATQEHALQIAAAMSAQTVQECEGHGLTPEQAVLYSLQTSMVADTAIMDGKPIAMWGLCPRSLVGERALLWMLDTPAVQGPGRKALLTLSRYFTEWSLDRYPVLECLIDNRHDKALRWVKWLGFRPTGGTVRLGAQAVEFIGLEKRRN